jgi:hypothetical protein
MLLSRRALLTGLPAVLAAHGARSTTREAAGMADYIGIPPIPKTAAADQTGKNPGNYSAVYQQSDFRTNVPYFEIPRMVITGGVILTTFTIYLATQLWDTAVIGYGGITVWSARNPMILAPGQEVWILFNLTVSGNTAPSVTLWPRYDLAIPANRAGAS